MSDALFSLAFLFTGGPEPGCLRAADANDDGILNIADAIFSLGYLFLGGAAIPAPSSECGYDSTQDDLYCREYRHCAQPVRPFEVIDGYAVIEGDIVIGTVGDMPLQNGEGGGAAYAIRPCGLRWPDAIVPYALDPALPNPDRVQGAIRHWEERTRIRFVARTTESDYVFFQPGTGCLSYIGRTGGKQVVELEDRCDQGSAIHEIGHAIGLWHEQSRSDRDQYVAILFDNIQPGREHNFEKQDGIELGPYDYDSIMHYPATAFGIVDPGTSQPRVTIETIPRGIRIGQRDGLSAGDIAGVALIYPGIETLASGLTRVSRIAVDSDFAFWTQTAPGNASARNGSLKKVPTAGGAAVTLVAGLGWPYGGIALTPTDAVYTDDWDGTVHRVSKNGGADTLLQPGRGLCCPSGPCVDDTYVYFTQYRGDLGQGRINKVPIAGGDMITIADNLTYPTVTKCDGAYIYFQDSHRVPTYPNLIKRVSKDGGAITVLVDEGPAIYMGSGIACDDSFLYWTVATTGEVKKMPKAGGAVTILARGLSSPHRIALDENFVYWMAWADGAIGRGEIQAVSLGGGHVVTLASGNTFPYGDLALGDAHVYFTEPGASPNDATGAIHRVLKPFCVPAP
jgi:hypothetical protein